jgi:HEAT repeat protein
MPLVRKGAPPPPPSQSQSDAASRLVAGTTEERWAAARDLATEPTGVGALGAALGGETDPRVREAIFTGLVRHGGADALDAVLPHLRSDDAGLRTGALDALRAMPDAAAPRLSELLADSDADVRILACELVRYRPAAEAGALLAPVLARDREVNVCASAVDVLAEVGGPDILPALHTCAARFPDEAFLRFAIKVAADRIGAPPRA